jgi:hypothetical protein
MINWENLKKTSIFFLTPTIEVLVTQPFWSVMKQMQSTTVPKPAVSLKPSLLYKGTTFNLVGFSLTIAMQMSLTESIQNKLSDKPTNKQKTVAALLAGIASSLVACPTDALMTWKQGPKTSSCPHLFKTLPATMIQESICSAFFLVAAPILQKALEPYIKNQDLLSFTAGTGAGVGAALISQPANTIRTIQQKQQNPCSFFVTARSIHLRGGIPALYQGTFARLGMVVASMAVMNFVKDNLERAFSNEEHSSLACR